MMQHMGWTVNLLPSGDLQARVRGARSTHRAGRAELDVQAEVVIAARNNLSYSRQRVELDGVPASADRGLLQGAWERQQVCTATPLFSETARPPNMTHRDILAVLVAAPPGLNKQHLHLWAACFSAQHATTAASKMVTSACDAAKIAGST